MNLFAAFCSMFLAFSAAHEEYIVGGQDVSIPGTYPWQGYLETRGAIPDFRCGSVLVGRTTALIAAHCVDSGNEESYQVTFGAHDRETEIEGSPTTFFLANISVHPNWTNINTLGFPNDLAVLQLDVPIPDNSPWIQPISIPEAGRTPDDWVNKTCTITGWGRLRGGGTLPNLLQQARVPVLTNEYCAEQWVGIIEDGSLQDYHVCVWRPVEQDRGACSGDSGGPLICEQDDGQIELVGITSWGISGCGTNFPSVYARVSYFRDWLDQVVPVPPRRKSKE